MPNIRSRPVPTSSRDLSAYTIQEIDQIRKSNASLNLTRWQKFKLFFWDNDKKTVCYCTGKSWGFICCFYPVFIILVLLMFYGMMALITWVIRTNYPDFPVVNKHSLTKEPKYH